jgi:hypothetical protein
MITFMKRSHLLIVLWGFLLAALPLAAQPATPVPGPAPREIYVALAFGDPLFAPGAWQASAVEQEDRTTATWRSAEYGALGYVELLHFNGGYSTDELRAWFDDSWFAVTFKTYDRWEQTAACQYDEVLVHEFTLYIDGAPFLMRYWVMPITPTRVLAFHLVFPREHRGVLADYSLRFAPTAFACRP